MTGSADTPRQPDVLLRLAQRLFDEPTRSAFVLPALADVAQELQEAGESRIKRLVAHARGWAALLRLLLAAPFIVPSSPLGGPVTTFVSGKYGGNLLLVLAVALFVAIRPIFGWFVVAVLTLGLTLAIALRLWHSRHAGARGGADPLLSVLAVAVFAAIWSMFGWFVLAAVGGGVIMAVVLRRWNTRHPSALAPSQGASMPGAEINLSSIPVAGDIGGLLFVIGAIVTVLLGLPDIRWFVFASVVVGAAMAGGLFLWRSTHAQVSSRANSILLR